MTAPSTPPEQPDQLFPLGQYHDLLSKGPFGDFRDALAKDGFVVVPAIPEAEALAYRERAFKWLEARSWGEGGFKRGDVSTYTNENLPVGSEFDLFVLLGDGSPARG